MTQYRDGSSTRFGSRVMDGETIPSPPVITNPDVGGSYTPPSFINMEINDFPEDDVLFAGYETFFTDIAVSWNKDSNGNSPYDIRFYGDLIENPVLYKGYQVGSYMSKNLYDILTLGLVIPSGNEKTYTWTIEGKYTDANGVVKTISISKSVTVQFGQFVLVKDDATPVTNIEAHNYGEVTLQNSKAGIFEMTIPAGKYGHILQPKRWGLANIYAFGFYADVQAPLEVDITLGNGDTETYYDYRFTNSGLGTINVLTQ